MFVLLFNFIIFSNVWQLSRISQDYLDCLDTFQIFWKLSGLPGNFPDCWKCSACLIRGSGHIIGCLNIFSIVWKHSRLSENFTDCPNTFQIFWEMSGSSVNSQVYLVNSQIFWKFSAYLDRYLWHNSGYLNMFLIVWKGFAMRGYFPDIVESAGLSWNLPDWCSEIFCEFLKTLLIFCKLFGLAKNFHDVLEAVCSVWKPTSLFGNLEPEFQDIYSTFMDVWLLSWLKIFQIVKNYLGCIVCGLIFRTVWKYPDKNVL